MLRNRPAFARFWGRFPAGRPAHRRAAHIHFGPQPLAGSMLHTLRRHGVLQVTLLLLMAVVLGTCAEQAFASGTVVRGAGLPLGVIVAKDGSSDEPGPYIWAGGGDRAEVLPVPMDDKYFGGRATIVVDAPLTKVRAALLDVARWREFMPLVSSSRLVAVTNGTREFELEGAASGIEPLRMRARLARSRAHEGETYVIDLVSGNVRELRALWTLAKASEGKTELSLELFVRPAQRVPPAALNRANLEATARAAVGVQRRAEGRSPDGS